MRIPFPFISYTHDDLCRKIRDYKSTFGKGCRIIRRAEFLEEIWYMTLSDTSIFSDTMHGPFPVTSVFAVTLAISSVSSDDNASSV